MLLLSPLLLLAPVVIAAPVLKQIQVVGRHGSRTPLLKSYVNLAEGAASLTPMGELQMYEVGEWLREQYGDLLGNYTRQDVRFESSSYERTVDSASALAMGLYPEEFRPRDSLLPVRNPIPVYTSYRRNDLALRAYDKCPNLYKDLEDLYDSTEFKDKQAEHRPFLQTLALFPEFQQFASGTIIRLHDVYNIYDMIQVAKNECTSSGDITSCLSLSNPEVRDLLSDDQWRELKELADWVELKKYSWSVAGRRVGGNLLHKIMDRMVGIDFDDGMKHDSLNPNPLDRKLYYYSAHYATILGLLSSLYGGEQNATATVPGYGAVLIFEMYEDDENSSKSVQIVYKESGQSNQAENLLIPQICNETRCGLLPLARAVEHSEYEHFSDWCDECDNGSANIPADVCWKDAAHDASEELETAESRIESLEQQLVNAETTPTVPATPAPTDAPVPVIDDEDDDDEKCFGPLAIAASFFGGAGFVGFVVLLVQLFRMLAPPEDDVTGVTKDISSVSREGSLKERDIRDVLENDGSMREIDIRDVSFS